jgi:hypothetical protein
MLDFMIVALVFVSVYLILLLWPKGSKASSDSSDGYDLGRGVLYTKQIGSSTWVARGTVTNFRVQLADDDDLDTALLREEL